MNFEVGQVYWIFPHRTFIVTKVGNKFLTGLIIESDGFHVTKVSMRDRLDKVLYHGKTYPQRKLRGWIRKIKPATKTARQYRKALLEG